MDIYESLAVGWRALVIKWEQQSNDPTNKKHTGGIALYATTHFP